MQQELLTDERTDYITNGPAAQSEGNGGEAGLHLLPQIQESGTHNHETHAD